MTQAKSHLDPPDSATYRERLRQLLPELRQIDGFPIGSDEDILALSDPPYYTACPNPFLDEFITEHGTPYDEATDDYHREPFAADVSEGKNDPIYNAHSYHTKVPHKAIMRYILHYTEPGDIVFDGFCGTGMTAVASYSCGTAEPMLRALIDDERRDAGQPRADWGSRRAVIGDLSPAATFIAINYNTSVDIDAFEREAQRILDEVEAECGWMYETLHTDGVTKGRINFTVWSDVYGCPNCGSEIVLTTLVDDANRITCERCGQVSSQRRLDRSFETIQSANGLVRHQRRIPTLIEYSVRGKKFRKSPDESDLGVLGQISRGDIKYPYPTGFLPPGGESQRNVGIGIATIDAFYVDRALWSFAALWAKCSSADATLRSRLLVWLQSVGMSFTLANRYSPASFSQVNRVLSGTLYVGGKVAEIAPWYGLAGKIKKIGRMGPAEARGVLVTTESATSLDLPENAVDYAFVDPPFGGNLQYSQLSAIWEAWLRVRTNQATEAVEEQSLGKGRAEYQSLMEDAFRRIYLGLKPSRWMTVEFHNTSNAVWNAIQEAIQRAGLVVADVRTLDKGLGTFKQTFSAGAAKQDLVISAYKPKAGFEQRFRTEAGTEQGAWDFVRQHLEQLPIFVEKGGRVEVVAERQNYLLFDRMIGFHIQRGATIPLSAAGFYAGLNERFPERDGMYFTEVQAAQYDQKRAVVDDIEQLSIFVIDEKSAIQWLRAELATHPQTFQDLQPKFLQELSQNRYEQLPELRDLLEQNFLEDPSTHRWRVPDPAKQADLEALRNRSLLAEFAEYLPGTGKLKRFRLEAIRAGVADLWAKRDYRAIIRLAERLPDEVVQEDPALLMYYDNAVTREGSA